MKAPEAKKYGMIDEVLKKLNNAEENLSCSFCGLSKLQTKVLVAGQDAHICDQCIEQAFSILNHQKENDHITTSSEYTGFKSKKNKIIP